MPQWWAFNWLRRAPAQPSALLLARLDAIERGQRDLQMLRLEWAEVLDKLTAWTNRQSARDGKILKSGLAKLAAAAEDAPGDPISEDPPSRPALTKQELRSRLYQRNGGME